MKVKRLLSLEWDAITGIVAAVAAIVLPLFHVVDEHVILPIVLALIALLFINFMRHTRNNELTAEQVEHTEHAVGRIQFVLDKSQRDLWQQVIQPKIAACPGNTKVREPHWHVLSKTVSFILADNQLSGGAEALLSFWGEPFMAQTTEQDVPRFIFHMQRHSELLPHLLELAQSCVRAHHD